MQNSKSKSITIALILLLISYKIICLFNHEPVKCVSFTVTEILKSSERDSVVGNYEIMHGSNFCLHQYKEDTIYYSTNESSNLGDTYMDIPGRGYSNENVSRGESYVYDSTLIKRLFKPQSIFDSTNIYKIFDNKKLYIISNYRHGQSIQSYFLESEGFICHVIINGYVLFAKDYRAMKNWNGFPPSYNHSFYLIKNNVPKNVKLIQKTILEDTLVCDKFFEYRMLKAITDFREKAKHK